MTPRQIGYVLQDSFNRYFLDNEAIGSFISGAINFLGWAILAYIILLAFIYSFHETKALSKEDKFNPDLKIEQPPELEIEYLFSDCNICKGKGYVEHEGKVLRCHFCASIFHQSQHYKAKNGK